MKVYLIFNYFCITFDNTNHVLECKTNYLWVGKKCERSDWLCRGGVNFNRPPWTHARGKLSTALNKTINEEVSLWWPINSEFYM